MLSRRHNGAWNWKDVVDDEETQALLVWDAHQLQRVFMLPQDSGKQLMAFQSKMPFCFMTVKVNQTIPQKAEFQPQGKPREGEREKPIPPHIPGL